MAQLITGLEPDVVRENLAAVRSEVGEGVQVLAATKYVALEEMGVLAEAGVTLCGENRAQDLVAKQAAAPELTWDFIGQLQSRKVKQILPLVRYVHSVGSESALEQLDRHGTPETQVLVQVNIAREEGKAGVDPGDLPAFLERGAGGPYAVVGLMTMPPLAREPEDSRRWFAALRELAERHGLRELSMGTTQDYAVAAQEGATIVRVGSRLYNRG
ncbi:YggS family pyridoxal phosphate enzyme [Capillimicrobium parvum]|uniref:Pyridoxal phosphate homeostasis protein n=1 Tax=Capillimicrobium parvum TaxID=2884022 RepID=A0A9E7C153_9ACTN|nr:YggS family pyridoxal phosphate enzyme [Capillimicrobium parvum]UGS36314.1 Pyridoxal phosphate homeostasis protein [Capillimicrobium parvum]